MEDFMPMTKVKYNEKKTDTTPWELETQIHSRNQKSGSQELGDGGRLKTVTKTPPVALSRGGLGIRRWKQSSDSFNTRGDSCALSGRSRSHDGL